jgi:predicted acyl esterase
VSFGKTLDIPVWPRLKYDVFMRRLKVLLVLLAIGPQFVQNVRAQNVREEMVPMRDGVRLATSIYLPEGPGPWPVVLTRTPYGKDMMYGPSTHKQFLDAGYARVVQDSRGKFKSEGKYVAFGSDMEDGYDTVEWIAKQPWSNQKVGMVGPSAMGIATDLAAMAAPPHLVTGFVNVATGSRFIHSNYPGGVFLINLNEEWLRRQGVPPNDVPRPINRVFNDNDRREDMRFYYERINIPMYNVGGWYDIFLQGNIDAFVGLQEHGAQGARGNQKLMMGAFGHGLLSGDLKYPAEAGNLNSGDQIRWFDRWLKGIDNGIMQEPPVRYYLMGDTFDKSAPGNQWRTAASWPPQSTATSYYLTASHFLTSAKPSSGKLTYVYDPKDPVPAIGGNNLMMDRGPMDQRKVGSRADVLKFETEVLKAPLEITGPIKADLTVSTDAEDTDFMVKLVDVYPNGYEALVLDGAFRLRYWKSALKPEHVEKNKPYPITVDLWSTALVFNTGHKIAVHVQSSNSPRFERNSNTWESVKSYDQSVKATNTVILDGRSKIVLPVTKVYTQAATTAAAR